MGGDSVQANKAGLLEIADVLAVNKADRDGVDGTRRDIEIMLDLSGFPSDAWRPPVVSTVATKGAGVHELWTAVRSIETSWRAQERSTAGAERASLARPAEM